MSKAVLLKIVDGIKRAQKLDAKFKAAGGSGVGDKFRSHTKFATHVLSTDITTMSEQLKTILDQMGLVLNKDYTKEELDTMSIAASTNIVRYVHQLNNKYIIIRKNDVVIATKEDNYAIARKALNAALEGSNAHNGIIAFLKKYVSNTSAKTKLSGYTEEDIKQQRLHFDVGHVEPNIVAALKAGIYNALRELPPEQIEVADSDLEEIKRSFLQLMSIEVAANALLKEYKILDTEQLIDIFDITIDFAREIAGGEFQASLRKELKMDQNVLRDIAQKAWIAVLGENAGANRDKGSGVERVIANHFLNVGAGFSTMFERWVTGQTVFTSKGGKDIKGEIPPLPLSEGSPAMVDMLTKRLFLLLRDGKVPIAKEKYNSSANVNRSLVVRKGIKIPLKTKPFGKIPKPVVPNVRGLSGRFQSLVNVVNMINLQLAEKIRQNMGSPRLNWRTGRFAESAKVLSASIDRDGLVRMPYTYMKMPYQTFEPGYAQGSKTRDPKVVISESIRQLATRLVTSNLRVVRI